MSAAPRARISSSSRRARWRGKGDGEACESFLFGRSAAEAAQQQLRGQCGGGFGIERAGLDRLERGADRGAEEAGHPLSRHLGRELARGTAALHELEDGRAEHVLVVV